MSATDPGAEALAELQRAVGLAEVQRVAALAERRRRARRTAWVVASVAVLVYAGFILTGVLGR